MRAATELSDEERLEIREAAKKQYGLRIRTTALTIAGVLLGLLLLGALVQLGVLLIAGQNLHFYGFVAYYIAVAIGMVVVAVSLITGEFRLRGRFSGTRYMAGRGTVASVRIEPGRLMYTIDTGLRYKHPSYVTVSDGEKVSEELGLPHCVAAGMKKGDDVWIISMGEPDEIDEVLMVPGKGTGR